MHDGSSRTKVLLGLLAMTLAVAVGIGVGAVLTRPDVPEALRPAEPVAEVPVTQREFTDQRSVELSLTLGQDANLTSPGAGRVTRWNCGAGAELVSGQSSLSIDGQRVINLATEVPLWRDLAANDAGEDVRAVQTELARLGYPVEVSGRVGSATLRAVADLFVTAGDSAFRGTAIPMSRLLWLPSPAVTVAACDAETGQTVAAGDTVATRAGGLAAAAITHLPEGAAEGDRVLIVDGQSIPVDRDGAVTSPEALAAISASDSYAQALRASATTLTVPFALADPVQVSVVPPGALYRLEGESGCVVGDGRPRAVRVVGSELGQSFVTFDDPVPAGKVTLSPGEAAPCR